MSNTSCGDISASLAALQSAIAGIGGVIDSKINPLIARIDGLEAALARATNGNFVKKEDLKDLVLPIVALGTISYATKDQLEYFMKEARARAESAESKATNALNKADDAAEAKRLAYEAKVKATQVEYENNALKTKVNNLPNDSQLANELKSRVAAVENETAKTKAAQAALDAENKRIKGEVTDYRTKANLASSKADEALDLAKSAQKVAGNAVSKADDALGGLRKLATKFGDDLAQLGAKFAGQLAKFAPLLALLGVVSTLLEVALQAGTLVVLGSRLDAIEAAIDRINTDMSFLISLIGRMRDQLRAEIKSVYDYAVARGNELLNEIYRRGWGNKTPELEALKTQITNLGNQFNNFQGSLVPTIDGRIASFLAGLGLGAIGARLTNLENATKNMPQCRYSPALDQAALAQAQANNKLSLGMQAFNTAQLNSVQSKLGSQLPGGLSAAASKIINGFNALTNLINSSFSKTWKFLKLDRVLNVLNFAFSLHNALMLSRSLGETLLDVTSSVLSAIGLRDANGSPFDLQEFFGSQIEQFIIGIVGQEAYEGNKAKLNAANRIISSAANLLWSMQSMIYNAIEGLEIIGGWIAKMANGLKFEGIVSDNSWGFFNPNPNFKNPIFKAMEKLDDLEDAASQIYMISNNVIDFQETAEQLDEQKKELAKAMNDYQTLANTNFGQANTDSSAPDLEGDDLIDGRELED